MPAVEKKRSAKLVGAYVVLGAAWIFLSDRIVMAMSGVDVGSITDYQTAKGLLFLLVTGFALYWLVLRSMAGLRQRLDYMSSHDSLTDLPKMALFREKLYQEVVHAKRSGRSLAIVMLNIDRFQHIVNRVGYEAGDGILKSIARRLGGLLRPGDIVARIGGDEFAVALTDIGHKDDVDHLVVRLVGGLKEPFFHDGRPLSLSTSFGVAIYPGDGEDGESLVNHAGTALRRSKAGNRGSVEYYTAKLGDAAHEWARIEHALNGALERKEFQLHYQPQFEAATRRLVGTEALIRWSHPVLGAVSPARFIPVAEASQLILAIGDWVLLEACRQGAAWRAEGLEGLVMSVNVSARQLKSPAFVAGVRQALEKSGLAPQCLEIEFTESMLMEDAEATLGRIKELKGLGVRIAIDDFGTGYSNLAYLRRFRADRLKIDQSFVRTLPDDQEARAIVQTVIGLGRTLGLRTIAEGVEETAQADSLEALGCEELQGYLLGRPMDAEAFEGLFLSKVGPRMHATKVEPASVIPFPARALVQGSAER